MPFWFQIILHCITWSVRAKPSMRLNWTTTLCFGDCGVYSIFIWYHRDSVFLFLHFGKFLRLKPKLTSSACMTFMLETFFPADIDKHGVKRHCLLLSHLTQNFLKMNYTDAQSSDNPANLNDPWVNSVNWKPKLGIWRLKERPFDLKASVAASCRWRASSFLCYIFAWESRQI